jgi:hypothetical protein
MRISLPLLLAMVPVALATAGCGGTPSSANIQLRKELAQRDEFIAALKAQHLGDLADLRASKYPTTSALPPDKLARLYTVHGISFGRLTAGSDFDSGKPGDQGLKIYVVPTDDDGQPLKSAGSFTVEAFDLGAPDNLIGRWTFDDDAAKADWFGAALLYNYVLPCHWQQHVPIHSSLTVRVTFRDELTGREFTEQRIVNVNPPPTTAP